LTTTAVHLHDRRQGIEGKFIEVFISRKPEIGPAQSRMQHFEDWVRLVDKVEGEGAIREQNRALMEKDYSNHYHVWTQLDFLELLLSLRDRLSYDIETTLKQADEFVIVLRKTGAGT